MSKEQGAECPQRGAECPQRGNPAAKIFERRAASRRELLMAIGKIVDRYQAGGFYGKIPLELSVVDGVVELVRVTGAEECIKIVPK